MSSDEPGIDIHYNGAVVFAPGARAFVNWAQWHKEVEGSSGVSVLNSTRRPLTGARCATIAPPIPKEHASSASLLLVFLWITIYDHWCWKLLAERFLLKITPLSICRMVEPRVCTHDGIVAEP